MNQYISILNPDNSLSQEEMKRNYRKLVKENHPDLFPEEHRREQNLVLMEINEAYLTLASKPNFDFHSPDSGQKKPAVHNGEMQLHKSPDYACYKTAFRLYQEGQFAFNNSRYSLKNLKKTYDTDMNSILQTALRALHLYIESYKFFLRLVIDYPDSVWRKDALEKIEYISKLNERYNTIIHILSSGHDFA